MIDLKLLIEHPELAECVKLEVTAADLLAFGESIQKKATQESRPKETETYLTQNELSEILHVSLPTIWAWDKKGITIPLRIGTRKLYRRSDIEKILKRNEPSERI
jgi:hypothetical protein